MSYLNFVPSFHFQSSEKKLSSEWCWEAVNHCFFNTRNYNLLFNKKVNEIEEYASGEFDMSIYRKMYKSLAKKDEMNPNRLDTRNGHPVNINEIGFVPLPLIPTKLNAATAVVQKIPIEVRVEASDELAAKKKKEDITFLKNKSDIENQLKGVADQMGVPNAVDLGTTQYSAIPFSDSPYGLDLNEPDQLQVFVDLLYNLGVEAAFETVLEEFQDLKNGLQVKLLCIKDQLKYGVSVQNAFQSSMTQLPDLEYVYPGEMEMPYSQMPDKNDTPHRFRYKRMSVMDMFNAFGDEICDEATLHDLVFAAETGYCACNGAQVPLPNDRNNFRVELCYFEVKSVDYVAFAPVNKKSKFTYVVTDPEEAKECKNKVWGQNTYGFWWLKKTKHFFGIKKLPYSYRSIGREAYQTFSSIIYKSQEKGAVELSIGENKKAQIADIKMQHAIIKSLPAGKYINLKFLRGAISGIINDGVQKYTIDELVRLAFEENVMIGDTEGFDGKNDGQLKPFEDIPGGIKSELVGYLTVISDANAKISQFTGINDQLTGQSANPEGLIGLQKLLINSSINALYYINESVANLEQNKFTIWGNIIKAAIEKGGKTKQAIIDIIGAKKVSLIDHLEDVPLHNLGIKVKVEQREEERQEFRDELNRLKLLGVITTSDVYMLTGVQNPRDRMALLAVKEKQWQKKQDQIRTEGYAAQQAAIQAQGQNQQQVQAAKTDGDIKKVYAQGDVSSKILELASQLGLNAAQLDGLIKKSLQQDRGNDQLNKSIKTLETKQELGNQEAFKQ